MPPSEWVMNTREEIVQAFEDFQSGKMGTIPMGLGSGVVSIEST